MVKNLLKTYLTFHYRESVILNAQKSVAQLKKSVQIARIDGRNEKIKIRKGE